MDTLVRQWGNNHAVPTKFPLDFLLEVDDDEVIKGLDDIMDRLAAYEKTGLTPEKVAQVNNFEQSNCARLLAERGELRRRLDQINNLAVDFEEGGPFDDPDESFRRAAQIEKLSRLEEGSGPR